MNMEEKIQHDMNEVMKVFDAKMAELGYDFTNFSEKTTPCSMTKQDYGRTRKQFMEACKAQMRWPMWLKICEQAATA